MTKTKEHRNLIKIFSLCVLAITLFTLDSVAAVLDRRNSQRPTTSQSRMPTMSANISSQKSNTSATTTAETKTTTTQQATTKNPEPEIWDQPEPPVPENIIEDKTSQFDETLDDVMSSGSDNSSDLAAKIRAQRSALDTADKISATSKQMQDAAASGKNACDQGLRTCMQGKCGQDYSKCAGDTDTAWGNKMDLCRRDLPCTGHEYTIFTQEIKADRDMNARIAGYSAIIECGNSYNKCIITECGTTFEKCLGKKAGDKAIQKCDKIARSCTKQDSGLASRMMSAFGTIRQDAEKAIARDEQRLYDLRDAMRSTCERLGAMFDERTLDCVYTVNFYAGEDNTLYASKKAYAGGTFNCDQNWFGVDITTFKENAMRATREQSSATSALMGAGIGVGVGAITSGAIDRAIDTHKAEKALKQAQKEHDTEYGNDKDTDENEDSAEDNKPDAAEKRCIKAKGTWADGKCTNAECGDKKWDDNKNKCVTDKDAKKAEKQLKREEKKLDRSIQKLQQENSELQQKNNEMYESRLKDAETPLEKYQIQGEQTINKPEYAKYKEEYEKEQKTKMTELAAPKLQTTLNSSSNSIFENKSIFKPNAQ